MAESIKNVAIKKAIDTGKAQSIAKEIKVIYRLIFPFSLIESLDGPTII